MESQKVTSKLDNIGMTASTLCAIHCALVPVFITSLPLLGLGFLANPWVEWSMIILAFIIGVSSIGSSYFRIHNRVLPLVLLTIGFAIIILGHIFITGWIEGIIVPLGGFTIATAHFINYKYAGACKMSDHASH
jgi:O-antigen/teichoic acid export membrane protein